MTDHKKVAKGHSFHYSQQFFFIEIKKKNSDIFEKRCKNVIKIVIKITRKLINSNFKIKLNRSFGPYTMIILSKEKSVKPKYNLTYL